jgi:integrase
MRDYGQALEAATPGGGSIGAGRTLPGSLNWLISRYYKSAEYVTLKASSQKVRRNVIERFRNERAPSGQTFGDKPLKGLTRIHIKEIVASKAETPEAANNLLKALRVLLGFAVDQQMIDHNPAIGVKRFRSKGDGYHCWTEQEITQFRGTYAIGTTERLVFALCLYTAQRISDVARMGWQHVRGERIAVRQLKTGAALLLPMHPELLEVLAVTSKANMTFLVDDGGAPLDASRLSEWFARQCDLAGLPACTAHGLRKAAATRLANAGCSVEMIKAVTGHKTAKEVERYVRTADQARLAEQALALLRAEEENIRAQNRVQPETRVVQPGS